MNIKFKQCHSANYKSGRTGKIEYIVIHYTAGDGDTAKNNADYYAVTKVGASAHYFVDEKEVWQSVKDTDTAWAVGCKTGYKHPRCRNFNSISVELCSRNPNGKDVPATDHGWYFKPKTVSNAVTFTRELMKKYNIPIENVIRHFDVWAKTCPAPFVNNPQQWADFKRRLEESPMTEEERKEFKSLADKVATLTEENKILKQAIGWNSDNKGEPALYAYNDENIKKYIASDGNEVIGKLISSGKLSVDANGAFAPLSKMALRLLIIQNRDL